MAIYVLRPRPEMGVGALEATVGVKVLEHGTLPGGAFFRFERELTTAEIEALNVTTSSNVFKVIKGDVNELLMGMAELQQVASQADGIINKLLRKIEQEYEINLDLTTGKGKIKKVKK